MRVKTVPRSWLDREGFRLDSGPYLSGAVETRLLLEDLSVRKDRLSDLSKGRNGGIFNGPQFRRNYVASPEHGVPFLTSGTMLRADHSNLPLLRRKDAQSSKLSYLQLRQGTSLISCSGTIGRMAYTRSDMDGMWASQDVMKVAPDPDKVPSGFIYAFLSSKFGVPLVVSRTYGAIIQHLEPEHLADVPVPRLGAAVEQRAHELVEEAATLRTEASKMLATAVEQTLGAWGVDDLTRDREAHPDVQVVGSSLVSSESRFDAFFYGARAQESDAIMSKLSKRLAVRNLGDVVDEVFETARFGRTTVTDARYGVPFLSISDLVRFDPRTSSLVSKKQVAKVRASVKAGWLILPRVGQLQGVFGTICFIPQHLDGVGVSDNNIRIVPRDPQTGGYLWAALTTRLCYQQVVRRACGTSIPYLDAKRVARIPVPWVDEIVQEPIARLVIGAMQKRSQASSKDDAATNLVEQAIEEAA